MANNPPPISTPATRLLDIPPIVGVPFAVIGWWLVVNVNPGGIPMAVAGTIIMFPQFFIEYRLEPTAQKRGYVPFDDKVTVANRSGGVCDFCGSDKNLSLDHIIPLARGGTDDPDNLRLLCRTCNSRKNARLDNELVKFE